MPLAAATGICNHSVAFSPQLNSLDVCGTLTGVTVTVTDDNTGQPVAAGQPVAIALPLGIVGPNNQTTLALFTEPGGTVNLPPLTVINQALTGSQAITATSTATGGGTCGTGNATINVTNNAAHGVIIGLGVPAALPSGITAQNLVSTTTPDGITYLQVLGSDNNVYRWTKNNGTWTDHGLYYSNVDGIYYDNTTRQQYFTRDNQIIGFGAANLPAGITVKDLVSTTGADGITYLQVLGSDNNVYRWTKNNGTWTDHGLYYSNVDGIYYDNTTRQQYFTRDNQIIGVGIPAALPSGITVKDLVSTTGPDGITYLQVLGSDNNVYRWTKNNGTWTDHGLYYSNVDGIYYDNTTRQQYFTRDNQIIGFGAANLPAGITVKDLVSTTGADGITYLQVLGSDGKVYRWTKNNGTWTDVGEIATSINGIYYDNITRQQYFTKVEC